MLRLRASQATRALPRCVPTEICRSQTGSKGVLPASTRRFSKNAASPESEARPVPPRNDTSSIVSAACRTAERSSPSRVSGCLSSASSATGSPGLNTVSIASRISVAGCVSRKAWPPESSAAMLKRASSVETRRARSRSAVIKAAVLPGWSMASRNATATASASSRSFAASTKRNRRDGGGKLDHFCDRYVLHASLVSAGRMASASKCSRARFCGVTFPR